MRYLLLSFLFISTLISYGVSAQTCFQSLKSFTKKLVKIEYHGESISKEHSDFFSDGIDEIMALAIMSGLELPKKKLKVFIDQETGRPGFDDHGDAFYLQAPKKISKDDKELFVDGLDAIFRHEVGHSVFYANAVKEEGLLGQIYRLYQKIAHSGWMLEQYSEMLSDTDLSLAEKNMISKSRMKTLLKLGEIDLFREAEGFSEIEYSIIGLDELFADVMAVMSLDDPKAISSAIKKDSANYRDFSDHTNDVDQWVPSNKRHHAYAPVRYFIYSQMMNRMDADKITSTLYWAIVKHVQELGNEIGELSVTDRNKHLIKILKNRIGQ